MGDITCAKCGEPWEGYYVYHEMEDWEKEKFLKGEGCPSCKFGRTVKEELDIDRHILDAEFRKSALEETDDSDAVLDRW